MNISIKIQNTLSSIILQTLPHENNPTISQFRTLVVQHEFRALSHNTDGVVSYSKCKGTLGEQSSICNQSIGVSTSVAHYLHSEGYYLKRKR